MNDLNDFCKPLVVREFPVNSDEGTDMTIRTWTLVLMAAVLLAAGPGRAADPARKDIVTTALEAGSFETLAAALKATGLVETLQGKGPFTVFAPTDEAFSRLPEGTVETLLKPENKNRLIAVLTHHVVPGKLLTADVMKRQAAATINGQRVNLKVDKGTVRVDGATVVTADIVCSNGVIHVIDRVILPATDTIPQTAEMAGTFKTLLAAAQAAGLMDVLAGDKPLTVFAPTDDAFAALPKGTIDSLLKPENKEKLAGILKFHVVAGRVYSDELLSGREVTSLQGGKLSVKEKDGRPRVLNAGLIKTDIEASNGVVHVIDRVLLPANGGAKTSAAVYRRGTTVVRECPTTERATYSGMTSVSRR